MNNKKNRKGFTIVELSIVVAVIAILAAVMIPTFSNIISKSQTAAAEKNAQTIYSNYVNDFVDKSIAGTVTGDYETDIYVKAGDYYVQIAKGGVVTGTASKTAPVKCYDLLNNGSVSLIEATGCDHTGCAK